MSLRAKHRVVPTLESLEERSLPSVDIVWTNRLVPGEDTFRPRERRVIDHAISTWESYIADFNGRAPGGRGELREHDTMLVQFYSVDLPGTLVGHAGGGVVDLDHTAAGAGWFVDRTPADNSEFSVKHRPSHWSGGPQGMDMYSVVLHELGHLLGLDHYSHARPHGLMQQNITPGRRYLPSKYDINTLSTLGYLTVKQATVPNTVFMDVLMVHPPFESFRTPVIEVMLGAVATQTITVN